MSMLSRFSSVMPRLGAVLGLGGRAYEAGRSDTRELSAWQPPLSSSDGEVIGSRDKIVARSRDMDRNNSWTHGGIDTRVDAVIGSRIRLEARPDFEAMRRTPEWAEHWAVATEAEFRIWANDSRLLCDVERHLQFGGLVRLAYQHFVTDGEACAAIYDLRRGGHYTTSVLVVDPDRLGNRNNAPDTDRLRGGVHLDEHGAAIAYDLRVAHPGDIGMNGDTFRWETIRREGRTGRPRFVHVFAKRRAQQRRGVSSLATGLKRLKMLERYDNAELEAALWNAINAFVIHSEFETDDIRDALAPTGDTESPTYAQQLLEYREKKRVSLGGGVQALHLFPKEKAEFLTAERPAAQFAAFESAVLRSLAGVFKLSYPQLSQDWASINYSSARALLNETWRGLMADRHLFTQAFCTPIYAAWLEEAVARGRVKVPGGPMNFYKWRAALTQCEWIGPGRGTVDPKKEQEAADLAIAGNRSSLAIEAAEQGLDYRDIMVQRSREMALAKRLGLNPTPQPASGPGRPADENSDAADIADRRESAGEDA